ncbi:recombinase family protein [Streptomyces sp. NPDC089799]|uniref:recombinase family protein n=1 Tax=Streptomyces sp. NPDC089799 TaxID=3155066 RepID=UPI0034181450
MLKVVRYVQAPEREAAAQFEALELVAQSRHWLVRDETFVDSAGPALLEYRPGLSAARKMLRSGFADGLLAPTYEHISPHFAEYERFLRDMEAHRWFVALALPETGR